jgi:DNA-binding MarR family transcriptional regulator/5S rRNA maturation endonuclease (ribonuclease M5)
MKSFAKTYTNRWGSLKQVHLPSLIVQNNTFLVEPGALKALTVLYCTHKTTKLFQCANELRAICKIGQERLIERTGCSRRTISRAIKSLCESGYIETIPDRKGSKINGSGVASYILLRPDTGLPLTKSTQGSVLFANKLAYFTLPICFVTKSEQHWSLANITSSETMLYFSALYLANHARSNEFDSTSLRLRKLSGLSYSTYLKAMEGLRDTGLIQVFGQKELRIAICDPYTGEALHTPNGTDEDDPANYYETNAKGKTKRLVINTADSKQTAVLIQSNIPKGQPIKKENTGELKICCPYHDDETPSCSVSPSKRCFQCFGCGKTGTVTALLAKLTNSSKAEAIKRTASFSGKSAEFHQPDSAAIAVYNYRDAKHKLLKQVLRYPNDEHGNKVIRQRRPCAGGYVWNTNGLPPMLFNQELLELGGKVVFLTEGEKDATTVTDLWKSGELNGIAMTSGGARSWDSRLAKLLIGKHVIVLPDSDQAGAEYAREVTTSLKVEKIEYRILDFAPTGAKDVTEYLKTHTKSEFAELAGTDWVYSAIGQFDHLLEESEPAVI